MRSVAVIAAFDERQAIADAVAAAPAEIFERVIVVDGGSRDGTPILARQAGAEVIEERRRGYGLAMSRGAAAAIGHGAEALVFFDGNGSVRAEDVRRVLEPVSAGDADLAIGSRELATLRPLQRQGNRLATHVIARAHGCLFRDVGAIRAVTADGLARLELDEMGYGWPLQLMVRAAARGLRTADIPVTMGARRGRSKVSGTIRGNLGASLTFLRILATECRT